MLLIKYILLFIGIVTAISTPRWDYMCKPYGKYDCVDDDVVKVCTKGFPCEQYALMPTRYSVCMHFNILGEEYHNKYLNACLFEGACYTEDVFFALNPRSAYLLCINILKALSDEEIEMIETLYA